MIKLIFTDLSLEPLPETGFTPILGLLELDCDPGPDEFCVAGRQ